MFVKTMDFELFLYNKELLIGLNTAKPHNSQCIIVKLFTFAVPSITKSVLPNFEVELEQLLNLNSVLLTVNV